MDYVALLQVEISRLTSNIERDGTLIALSNVQCILEKAYCALTKNDEKDESMFNAMKLAAVDLLTIVKVLMNRKDKFINHLCYRVCAYSYFYATEEFIEFISCERNLLSISYLEIIIEYVKIIIPSIVHYSFQQHQSSLRKLFSLIQSWDVIFIDKLSKEEFPSTVLTSFTMCRLFCAIKLITKLYLKLKLVKHDISTCLEIASFSSVNNFMGVNAQSPFQPLLWSYAIKLLIIYLKFMKENIGTINNGVRSICKNSIKLLLNEKMLAKICFVEEKFNGVRKDHLMKDIVVQSATTGRLFIIYLVRCLLFVLEKQNNLLLLDHHKVKLMLVLSLLCKFPAHGTGVNENLPWMLVNVFIEQDDHLVDILSLLLQLYKSLKCVVINPHLLMYELLKAISFDETVFIDWIVSNESRFSDYFPVYLNEIAEHYGGFVETIASINQSVRRSDTKKHVVPSNESHDSISVDVSQIKIQSLVVYSSSEDDEKDDKKDQQMLSNHHDNVNNDDDVTMSNYIEELDLILSCFIRLRLKLSRLYEHLPSKMRDAIPVIESIENFYEMEEQHT